MMNKFRGSFTILNTWKRGQWKEAIKMYFHLDDFETPAMREGKKYHEHLADYIDKNKQFPEELGGGKLHIPKTELKIVKQLEDWLEIVGVIDCLDGDTIYEFKTGITESDEPGFEKQIGMYAYLAAISGYKIKKGIVIHYNQHIKKVDNSTYWVTPKLLKDTGEWIQTIASEMHNYFNENKLYKRFSKI